MSKHKLQGAWDKEILDLIETYSKDVTEGITKIAGEVGKDTKEKIRDGISSQGIKGTTYSKSWTVKKEIGKNFVHITVHATKPHWRLTHLLENGHATRDGGNTRKFPHIKPAEDFANAEFEARVKTLIENGGKE